MIHAGCVNGMYISAFIIGIEFISPKWRVVCANFQQILFAVGELLLCLLAYHFRDWRELQLSITLIFSSALILPFLLPESVRWQVSNGQSYEAIKTINRAARLNKVEVPNECLFVVDEVLSVA